MKDFDRKVSKITKNRYIVFALCLACICIQGCSSKSTKEVKIKSDSSEVLESEKLKLNLQIQSIDSVALSNAEIGGLTKEITVQILGQSSSGSGVLIAKDNDTYAVATAWHVLRDQREGEELFVQTSDERMHKANYHSIRRIKGVDLAVVNIKSDQTYPIAKIGRSSLAKPGEKVFVSGFPLPTTAVPKSIFRLLQGNIIANTSVAQPDGYQLMYSNSTLPGMSGAPVISRKGGLIGIHGRGETDIVLSEQKDVAIKTGVNQAVPISHLLSNSTSEGRVETTAKPDEASLLVSIASQRIELFNKFLESMKLHFSEIHGAKRNASCNILSGMQSQIVNLMTEAIAIDSSVAYYYYLRGLYKSLRPGSCHYYFTYISYDLESRIQDFDAAIKLDPGLAKAYVQRARYMDNDNPDKEEYYLKAISLDPFLEEAYLEYNWYLHLGYDLDNLGGDGDEKRLQLIRDALDKLPTSSKLNSAYADLLTSIAYQDRNDVVNQQMNEDRQRIREEFEAGPKFRNQLQLALEYLNTAIKLDPLDKLGLNRTSRGKLKAKLGDIQGAIRDISHVINQTSYRRSGNLFDRHSYYIEAGKFDKAVDDLSQIIQLNSCKGSVSKCASTDFSKGYINDYQLSQTPIRRALLLKNLGRKKAACSALAEINLIDNLWHLKQVTSFSKIQMQSWIDECEINTGLFIYW